jgi:hypothetical protein
VLRKDILGNEDALKALMSIEGFRNLNQVLASEEFSHIQSGDNRQSRSADSGQCADTRLPNLCCCYAPFGCIPLTFVACGTASTE